MAFMMGDLLQYYLGIVSLICEMGNPDTLLSFRYSIAMPKLQMSVSLTGHSEGSTHLSVPATA